MCETKIYEIVLRELEMSIFWVFKLGTRGLDREISGIHAVQGLRSIPSRGSTRPGSAAEMAIFTLDLGPGSGREMAIFTRDLGPGSAREMAFAITAGFRQGDGQH